MVIFIGDQFCLHCMGGDLAGLLSNRKTSKDNANDMQYYRLKLPLPQKGAVLIKETKKAGLRCDLPLTSSKPAWLRDLLLTDKSLLFNNHFRIS